MSTDFPSSSLNTNKVGFEPSTPLKKENKKNTSFFRWQCYAAQWTYHLHEISENLCVKKKKTIRESWNFGTCCGSTTKCSLIFLRKSRPFFSSRNGTTCSSNVIVLTVAFAYFFPPNFFINSHKMMHTQKHWLQRPLNCHIINP